MKHRILLMDNEPRVYPVADTFLFADFVAIPLSFSSLGTKKSVGTAVERVLVRDSILPCLNALG